MVKASIMDIFKIKKIKEENERLSQEVARMTDMLTPEMKDAIALQSHVDELHLQEASLQNGICAAQKQLSELQYQIDLSKGRLVDLDEQYMYQDFALYTPRFNFAKVDDYKKRLDSIRQTQKLMLKNGIAATGFTNWQVNNSAAQGRKMVQDMQKLLLRAFNLECDEAIDKVTYANVELSRRRIESSCDSISKLGKVMGLSISPQYKQLKIDELYLAYEYAQAKQKEKEEQKELRRQQREEAKLQKEIEEARKKTEKEQKHYISALSKLNEQLLSATDDQKIDLLEKKKELEDKLTDIDKAIKDIDYREANIKAGYVYIISNIGAFGENIYKIGMTRRLDPMERVDELGDASVPFDFDVHAMIFSSDAPALEAALHRTFESKKLNMVNHRREFFNVTLDEIKLAVKANFDKTVEFVEYPPAEQYRISMKMKSN